ncbi:MAG TPA: hypothetical protein VFK12_00765 [Gammaproteobacteria bacterium]|nr:hypothetical protein [Gammaproteobacteria bacterium]
MNRYTMKLATIGAVAMLVAGSAFAQSSGSSTASASQPAATNMFGGPVYNGAPALTVTAALVKAGGGAENFSFSKALVSMLGEKTVNAEVAKLTKQYGQQEVQTFITGMDYAVKDGVKRATEAGIKLPAAPADLHGVALAHTLVTAGTTSDGTWWSGYLFDKALSHQLHNQVMEDINTNVSAQADMITHKLLNQAMFDVAHALDHKHVKLASLH